MLSKIEKTIWYIINAIAFIGAMIFVTNNYLKSESISTILFGAMLGLVFIKYVANDTLYVKGEKNE